MDAPHRPLLINIVGPTAVGKTAVAIEVARHFNCEILSSDSRQFYREVSIGTAKPSTDELGAVPHHFINSLSVTDVYSAGDFGRDATQLLETLFAKQPVQVMVGGSGLYVDAVIKGLDALPERDESLRQTLHELFATGGLEALQQQLRKLDPEVYARTEVLNPQRVMRAIEVVSGPTRPARESKPPGFDTYTVGLDLPRAELYERINLRTDQMMADGLEDEVKRMLPFRDTYAMKTVGYKEIFDYLDGNITRERAVELIKQHTRNYAKRQLTWFRRNPETHWYAPGDLSAIIRSIEEKLK